MLCARAASNRRRPPPPALGIGGHSLACSISSQESGMGWQCGGGHRRGRDVRRAPGDLGYHMVSLILPSTSERPWLPAFEELRTPGAA